MKLSILSLTIGSNSVRPNKFHPFLCRCAGVVVNMRVTAKGSVIPNVVKDLANVYELRLFTVFRMIESLQCQSDIFVKMFKKRFVINMEH